MTHGFGPWTPIRARSLRTQGRDAYYAARPNSTAASANSRPLKFTLSLRMDSTILSASFKMKTILTSLLVGSLLTTVAVAEQPSRFAGWRRFALALYKTAPYASALARLAERRSLTRRGL